MALEDYERKSKSVSENVRKRKKMHRFEEEPVIVLGMTQGRIGDDRKALPHRKLSIQKGEMQVYEKMQSRVTLKTGIYLLR